jgi:enoyl-CoA hydratase/carnithine racemase
VSEAADRIELGTRHLEARVTERVMHVRIARPEKRNAITQEMYRGLKRAAVLADGDPELDALCLTGTDDVFASGGDMSGQSEDPEGLAMELDPTDQFPFRHLGRCRKTVVAAVNGLCHAGGLNLVLYSDVILASDRARFRVPELLRGVPDPWMAARLPAFVGLARAKYLLFTAGELDAHEAAAMGLVAKVVPHETLDEAVAHALQAIRRTGPKARADVKEEMERHVPTADINLFRRSLLSPEMVEGMKAFLEKREPSWPRG